MLGFSLETFNSSLDAFADKVGERVCRASSLETFSCSLAAFAEKVGKFETKWGKLLVATR